MKQNKDQRSKYILISIGCIIILSYIVFLRIDALTKINDLSMNIIPEEMINFSMPYEIEATGYETFESESKDFKITFPNNWSLENGKSLLQAINGEIDKIGAKTIFLVYKITGITGNVSFLLVEETSKTDMKEVLGTMNIDLEINTNAEEIEKTEDVEDLKNIEDIINQSKQLDESSFKNISIIEQTENSLLLEISAKEKEGTRVHSYNKILILEDKSYMVSLITLETCWESEKDGFLEIIDSIKFE